MYFEDTILDYIELVRDSVPNAVEVFTKGNCGSFARMMEKTFPGGVIKHNISHAIYQYDGNWYDITGRIDCVDSPMYVNMKPIVEFGVDRVIFMLKPKYKT